MKLHPARNHFVTHVTVVGQSILIRHDAWMVFRPIDPVDDVESLPDASEDLENKLYDILGSPALAHAQTTLGELMLWAFRGGRNGDFQRIGRDMFCRGLLEEIVQGFVDFGLVLKDEIVVERAIRQSTKGDAVMLRFCYPDITGALMKTDEEDPTEPADPLELNWQETHGAPCAFRGAQELSREP